MASVSLPESAGVVIIGGGVIGASIAFHLIEAGVRDVLVLERDEPASGSSGKPIGGVRAQFSDPLNIRLGQRSLEAWREFGARPGADIGLRSVGYLFLLTDDADVATFGRGVEVQNELGVPSRIITPREALALCPYLDPRTITAAAYSPADGYALPGAAVTGYLRAARRHGATVRTRCAVTAIETDGAAVRAVRTRDGTVRTPAVICAAGAWSGAIGAMAGVDLPVTPLRRQIALTGPLTPPPPRIPFTLDFGSTLPRGFREADGSVTSGSLRVRFNEVEARGIALTRRGRALYDELVGEPAEQWECRFPATERELAVDEHAFFTYEPVLDHPADGRRPPRELAGLLDSGRLTATPIVYEDFLPRSAAGIFQSNLTDTGIQDTSRPGAHYDAHWLSEAIGRPVHDSFDLYAAQQNHSLERARRALGIVEETP
ncbi:FAD-dependent oxidoreductase [Streptomyces sp. NPDC051219]|uniref:FAD-dependent oxidoreductase n=1 Tax=Streptomyces sp. NPDC051219 TaxID=3155283 RepID=UPI00344789D6